MAICAYRKRNLLPFFSQGSLAFSSNDENDSSIIFFTLKIHVINLNLSLCFLGIYIKFSVNDVTLYVEEGRSFSLFEYY